MQVLQCYKFRHHQILYHMNVDEDRVKILRSIVVSGNLSIPFFVLLFFEEHQDFSAVPLYLQTAANHASSHDIAFLCLYTSL